MAVFYSSIKNFNKKIFILKHGFFAIAFILFAFTGFAQTQLILKHGSYLVLNNSVALVTNNAAINNNGTIVPANATFYFTGSSDTTLSYITGTSTTTCTNLTINKIAFGTAIKSFVNVTGVLTMGAGNLYPDSNLTLISTAANTARVAPVPASCKIPGKAFVQRYIPARRAWRLMTAPITNANTIYDTWQNSGVYTIGKGTLITAPVHTTANGIDISPENNYSACTFNFTTQAFSGVANTKVPISTGSSGSADNTGYFLFVRGDRNPSNVIIPNCNITTLSSNGQLQTGNQTFNAAGIYGQYTLIGNPYASPLDFSKISRTNVVNRFYAWDPTLNTLGAFVVLDDVDGDGIYTKSISASSQTTSIQSSQAFFVQTASTASASVTISESNKSTTNNNLVFRPASVMPKLIANLYLSNADSTITLADGALEEFDNRFSDSVNLDDAKKMGNTNENLSFLRHGSSLAMERRPDITINDTLFLNLTSTTRRNYQLELIGQNINHPELTAYFQDLYLKTSTPLNLTSTTEVNFSVTADAASLGTGRFQIVFKPAAILPVTFTTVKAYKQNSDITVEWNVENETLINQYEIEKSTDGKNFSAIGTVAATGIASYQWIDVNPVSGDNLYRIKSINKDGSFKYSGIVKVVIGNTSSFISVYPNPLYDNNINIQFNNQPIGNYHIQLLNDEGQMMYDGAVIIKGNNVTQSISIKQFLAKGIYQLKLNGPAGNNSTQKILVQ